VFLLQFFKLVSLIASVFNKAQIQNKKQLNMIDCDFSHQKVMIEFTTVRR